MILIFGRSWWGPFLVIGSVVLLTLLLAPDAYIAIGFAFALLLLTTLGVIVYTRATSMYEERTQPVPLTRYRRP